MRISKKRGPRVLAVATFLSLRDVVKELLDKGWTMSAIFAQYEIKLGVCYSQFTRYVERFIRPKEQVPQTTLPKKTAAKKARRDGPIIPQTQKPKRFVFDPTAAHRRKDELF